MSDKILNLIRSGLICFLLPGLALTTSAFAQDAGLPSEEALSSAYKGESYSPYAGRNFPSRPLFGDSHVANCGICSKILVARPYLASFMAQE